jgi:serine/threonine-protein kinase
MSEKHDQEYFSDGLAEELLDLLAQVPDLKVPARTSSFYFKTHPASVPELAKILGVRHILEGSVRKSGNTVRVTVQLIRADTGYHLWSRTFDRDLTDVFKVQDEIASAVVQALQGKLLSSATLIGARQTSSPQAHDLYLLGRQRYSAGSVESDRESMSLFRQATTADPNYAAAYAALSLAEGNLMTDLGRIETLEEYQRRLSDAERAVSLGPKISDGFGVRGDNHLANGEWELARLDLEKAIELDPHDSRAQRFLARYYASQGQLARAIEAASQAMNSDPFDSYARVWRGQFEMAEGQNDAARADLERVMQLNPANRKAESFLAYLDAVQGQPDAALAHARALPSDSMRVPLESAARCVRNEGKDAVETLNRWMAGAESRSQMYAAAAYALCGQIDKALTALEHDVLQSTHLLSETLEVLKYHAFFAPLRGEPRYQALLRKANLPE